MNQFILESFEKSVFNPLGKNIKLFSLSSIPFFSKNKKAVKGAATFTLDQINKILKGNTDNPIKASSDPKDDSSAKVMVSRFSDYCRNKGIYVSRNQSVSAYTNFKRAILKILSATGIVLTGVVASRSYKVTGWKFKDLTISGKILFPFVTISALLLTILCIYDAVFKSRDTADETKEIDLSTSYKNVLKGFKKYLTTLKIQRKESSFAVGSTIVAAFALLISKYFSTFGLDTAGQFIGKILSNLASGVSSWAKNLQGDEAIRYGVIPIKVSGDWIKDMSSKYVEPIVNHGGDVGKKIGAASGQWLKFAIVTACIVTVLYLFTEMVDEFNKHILKKKDTEEDENIF